MNNKNHMNTSIKPLAALVAFAMTAMAHPAFAQQAPVESDKLETVLVTANKRVEKLESVPMAISVLTEAEIQRRMLAELEA